jgi:hypothetical protein
VSMTREQLGEVEDYLKKEYFLLRKEVLVAVLAVAGVGGLAGAWAAINGAVSSSAANEATNRIKSLEAEAKKAADSIADLSKVAQKQVDALSTIRPVETGPALKEEYRKQTKSYGKHADGSIAPTDFEGIPGLSVTIKSTGRPIVVSLNGRSLGMDTGPAPERWDGGVYARVRIMRDGKEEVGIIDCQSDASRVIIAPSSIQVLDPKPPDGDRTYSVEVSNVLGEGIFYFSAGTRMVAWEL